MSGYLKKPGLTPAERELLTVLVEEAAEVIQSATKILRFGINRSYDDGTMNLDKFAQEMADFRATWKLLIQGPNFAVLEFAQWARMMQTKIARYTENDWVKQIALSDASIHNSSRLQNGDER